MSATRRWLPVVLAVLWLAAMGLIVATRMSVTSEITHFLAAGDDARLARLSRQLAESELTKTTILVVGSGSGDRARALAAADALADTLERHEEVAWVRRGWDPNQNQAIHEIYFPRRFDFASEDPAELDQRLSSAGLAEAARDLVAALRLPTATILKQTAPRDPLLLYPAHLRRLEAARAGPLKVVDDRFVTEDGRAVVFLASVHSPFRAAQQGPLQATIAERFAELELEAEAAGDTLTLEQSGVGRFALRAEAQIRSDITRISVISMLGVIVLFLGLFRSPVLLVLAMVPLVAGVLTATGIGLLVFGQLHGLTLAFGASLIGVCIDYPIHLFTHHALAHGRELDRASLVARVRPGLLLGALTTVAGFVGLGWTAFPGVREIAVFAALGILAALATTLWVLPALLPSESKPVRSQQWLFRQAERMLAAMTRNPRGLLILPALAGLIMVIGLPQLRYQDDVSALTEIQPDLLAEDEAVRAQVSRMDAGRMIVAIGDDDASALARNDAVYEHLAAAQAAGELAEFRSLHTFLWSPELQAANRARFCAQPGTLAGDLDRAFVGEGLRPGAFAAFADDLDALCERGQPAPLDWATLAGSPLGPALASMRTELGDQVAILTLVRGVEDPDLLRVRLADLDEVEVFDQRALMTEIYGRHRAQTIELVGLGLIVVLLIIVARHRRWRPSLAAFTPALLAATTTLAVLILLGQAITLLHVVALLLVLSMGVDYGVFLTESREHPGEVAATVVSLLACCLSTVLAFGLLGMSSNPALQAIGLTTGIGVLLSLILAPTALVLLGAAPRGPAIGGLVVVLVASLGACVTPTLVESETGSESVVEPEGSDPEGGLPTTGYPGTLIASTDLGSDFVARQKLHGKLSESSASTQPEREFRFEAVVQLRGGVLTIIGLTPFGSKAFVLVQTGTKVEFQSLMDRELPFPPEYMLQDIHRTWFWHQRLPWKAGPPSEETPQAEVEGERVREHWTGGSLVRRSFERLDGAPAGLLRIDYIGGHRTGKPAAHVVIDNAWFGYRLEIETAEWRSL